MIPSNDIFKNTLTGSLRPAASSSKQREAVQERSSLRGRKAALNFIPDNEIIQSLIQQAKLAMSKGIFWDRGSIINIVL